MTGRRSWCPRHKGPSPRPGGWKTCRTHMTHPVCRPPLCRSPLCTLWRGCSCCPARKVWRQKSMSLTLFNGSVCFSTASFSFSSNSSATDSVAMLADPMVFVSVLLSESSAQCRSWSRKKFSSLALDPVVFLLYSSLKNPKSCWLHPNVTTGPSNFCSLSRGPLGAHIQRGWSRSVCRGIWLPRSVPTCQSPKGIYHQCP